VSTPHPLDEGSAGARGRITERFDDAKSRSVGQVRFNRVVSTSASEKVESSGE